ncbi:UvrD-helicase domain-containing protein [Bacillota bacterium Lsc_1132]
MKTALFQNKLITLDALERGEYQKIYNAGKMGDLSCPACHEEVRLYLGIKQDPYFFHIRSVQTMCRDAETEPLQVNETAAFVEQNGFRLPKGRSITVEKEKSVPFRSAKIIQTASPFRVPSKAVQGIKEHYLQQLTNRGISLDHNQAAAVVQTEGSLLVLAGAGSGKTRVLTARTAYMLEVNKIDPRSIMLVTFTSKAAQEMKKRLLAYPNMDSAKINQLVTGTFHSIFYRILLFHSAEKWSGEKLLKMDWQRDRILKEAGKERGLSEKEFAFDLALQQIGFWKNSLIVPNEVKPETKWEEDTAFLYQRYEDYKKQKGLFDFDDMLVGCYELFASSPPLLEHYQNRFHYFLIDEFQDVNKVQYELIKLFSAKSKNVCAVGDDDQSIYSFRGSDPSYLLEFEKDFPNAEVITLNQNYRSTHEIVSAANRIIAANQMRRPKKMAAQFSTALQPIVFFPFDEEEEATMVVTDLQEKIADGANPSDFAILYRTNSGSRAIFERLANSNLPFKIDQDADSFYERRIVKSILAFLKISLNEDDAAALSDILSPLFLKQTVLKDIKAASILKDCSFLEALGHVKTAHPFQEKKLKNAVALIRSLKTTSPIAAIEIIEKDIGFQDFLKKRGTEATKLEKGSDDVKDLKVAAKPFDTIGAFLEHARHMAAMNKEVKKMGKHFDQAITLSTIHRAKGLEYPTVYVIGAVEGSLPHDFALGNADRAAMEEERRLLYVAVTRARNQLYLSVPEKRRGKKANSSRFLAPLKSFFRPFY